MCSKRGADLDEKLRRKETVDAAKSRLTTAAEKGRVNEGLARILPARRFGAGRRSIFTQRPKQQLNARILPDTAAASRESGSPQAGEGVVAAADASAARRWSGGGGLASTGLGVASVGAQKTSVNKKTLGLPELLFVLKRDPVYARTVVHHRIRSEFAAECAAAVAPS
jgi:hypothetical protein